MIAEEIRSNNTFYSKLFGELVGFLEANPELAVLPFDDANSSISDFMSDFRYNVSPWPVIIDDATVRTFSRVVDNIPAIMIKVINHYLEADPKWLCDYLNVSEVALERFKKHNIQTADIMCRYDAIMADKKLKLVEINIGSSLGGWWSDWLYPEIQQVLDGVKVVKDWNHKYRKVSENTFKAVWQSILRLKGSDAQGNVFIYLPDTATNNLGRVHEHLNDMVMSTKPAQYPNGQLFIFNDLDAIEWMPDGNIRLDGTVMDTLMLPIVRGDELPISFQAKLQAYSEKNKFYYPDNEGLTLLSLKLLFALVHEEETHRFLSSTERALIEEHIPWSTKLNNEQVFYGGSMHETEDFIIANQQKLVFKKSQSMQGLHVIVGESVSPQEWLQFYHENRHDPDWLIQAYCAPDLIYSADQKVGLSAYRMVWGIFGFDNKYAGAWCRGVAISNDDTVINLARGAVEFVVTEEQQQKRKLVL